MIRRILLTGLGGFAGFVFWFYELAPADIDRHKAFAIRTLILCVVGAGALVEAVLVRIRIIPSQEQLDKKLRPISLFSPEDKNRRT